MQIPDLFYKKKCWIFSGIAAVILILVIVLLAVFLTQNEEDVELPSPPPITEPNVERKFDSSFIFGASSAAYQIEGGWNADGKGPSIWDTFTRMYPEKIADRSNGNIAANSYELYKEDVKLLKAIGVNHYRFSISWPRMLPNGDTTFINYDAVKYYDSLIDELLAADILPMITMYHWDLPQRLQDMGGWLNPLIIDYFVNYADFLFGVFGQKVRFWITINEPALFCVYGYGMAEFPPMINMSGVGDYLCGHHALLAHARAYRLYNEKYAEKFDGRIGISLDIDYTWPKDPEKSANIDAAERFRQMKFGWFAHPIFTAEGGYPTLMKHIILANSMNEGRSTSRLPNLSTSDIDLIRGSADFLGLNYYSSSYSEPAANLGIHPNPSYDRDLNVSQSHDPSWPRAKSPWIYSVPAGLRSVLQWIKKEYSNPMVIITENGWSDDGQINDANRSDYIRGHLDAVLDAILLDESKVVGYTYCGLLDNFEWTQGYTEKFGLVNVNFNSPKRERVLKKSAQLLSEIIQTREIPQTYPAPDDIPGQFPRAFKFGAATSSYQIEGGWNKDGKGPSIWDTLVHVHPELVEDNSNGNIAANSYEYYLEDVKAAKAIGLDLYRFSISWSRVLPSGDISSKNELGLQYYDNLISALISNEIEPMITMYHYDLPQALQDLGGWTNPIIIDYFEQYAKLLFERYGKRVKKWLTLNQPSHFCHDGYGAGTKPPLVVSPGIGEYLCGHHVLIAHARVYRLYHREYYSQKGKIGIVPHLYYYWPMDPNNSEDVAATNRGLQFENGWFLHPIYSEKGDYPPIMRQIIDKNSLAEGFKESRLPKFSDDEIAMIKDSSDFIGVNYYTTRYVKSADNNSGYHIPSNENDQYIIQKVDDVNWPQGCMFWLYSVPKGLRDLLNWIKSEYSNPEVIITENGWCDDGKLNDFERIQFIHDHLEAILDAIWKDSCHVTGYTYWSLIDNFEWLTGYKHKFGLYHVDFDKLERTRTPRNSSFYLDAIIKSKQLLDLKPPAE